MSQGFWKKLKKPIIALAPMSDVTDAAFRRVIAKYGKPDVMWTEFVSADGLFQGGKKALMTNLKFTEKERPIVAQFFTIKPENMHKAAKLAVELGFDGVDINMGCPDRSIEKQGAGAALMKNPKLARELIKAAKKGAESAGRRIPVSVKTRIGYKTNEIETWLLELLVEEPAAITIHARTRKEMSDVPARWDVIKRAVEIRDSLKSKTLILGNGDIMSLADAKKKAKETGADGVMLGRAIFGAPWMFANLPELKARWQIEHPVPILLLEKDREKKLKTHERSFATQSRNRSNEVSASLSKNLAKLEPGHIPTIQERLSVMVEHTLLFEKLFKSKKNFSVMKKHFKAYVFGWNGAKELRMRLMEVKNAEEVKKVVKNYLKTRQTN
ncbi:MAG: tRNA-dihydrouridine synthase family protein [Candidatus Pacebacteria bacterium]|nr:tRNA-dihydrouridine synthase family protein [Candidatus Paceibacterota bacterium]